MPLRPAALFAALIALALLPACVPGGVTGVVDLGDRRNLGPPREVLEDPTFYIEPFIGVPVNTADRFERYLRVAFRAEGLTVVRREERPHALTVHGNLNAISDDTSSVVLYSFDIRDARTGALLHRISGQQTSGRSRSDPWFGVLNRDLRTMAEIVAALTAAWLDAAPSPREAPAPPPPPPA